MPRFFSDSVCLGLVLRRNVDIQRDEFDLAKMWSHDLHDIPVAELYRNQTLPLNRLLATRQSWIESQLEALEDLANEQS